MVDARVIKDTRELPLLCKQEVAQNIWLRKQWQDRRPVKFHGESVESSHRLLSRKSVRLVSLDERGAIFKDTISLLIPIKSPFGVAGDVLYVRENYGYLGCTYSIPGGGGEKKCWADVVYLADGSERKIYFDSFDEMSEAVPKQNFKLPENYDELDIYKQGEVRGELASAWWKKKKSIPSIHMPKWASRMKLRVKRVWVERVQSISNYDAQAEGLGNDGFQIARFQELWDELYGTWDDNPFVWCCEFELIEGNQAEVKGGAVDTS